METNKVFIKKNEEETNFKKCYLMFIGTRINITKISVQPKLTHLKLSLSKFQ